MKNFKRLLWVILIFNLNSSLHAQTFPDSEKDGKYILVNGAKLWVVSFGEGDPIFLIAGGPGDCHTYLRSFDSLSVQHLLVYFDAYGRGKSDTARDPKEYSLERDISDLEGLRIAFHLEKINVLGHSYGGVVAQGYALKYPARVSHLILANTFHSYLMWQENDDNMNRIIRTNLPEIWDTLMLIRNQGYISSDPLHQRIYARIPSGMFYAYSPDHFKPKSGVKYYPDYPNAFNSKLYYQLVGRDGDFIVGNDIGAFDYRTQLKTLSMPVLILAGRYDRVAVPWMMVKYRQYCPRARFVMFEESGHNPQIEEPQKEFEIIHEFLSH
jgi:proline iminopeptidase